ncbi:NfeD family protein [Balneolales bacterium ANBcel1]|nr:NfeD family protein [Balneolales bacterium ANBcel1]
MNKWFAITGMLLVAATATLAPAALWKAYANETGDKVYVIRVEGLIDNGLYMYIDRGLSVAESDDRTAGVILHMDTFGGLVDAADKIRKRLLATDLTVVTFIDANAASAGALISYATSNIFMAPGGSIGAATVVDGTGEKADEKLQSYMRGLMRSTAEAKGYDPAVAEAMVDERIEIEGIIAEGELLTLSASEALALNVSTATVRSIREVAAEMGWEEVELFDVDERWQESVIRFFASPILQSLLMLMMLGGLYFELQSPGIGFAGAIAGIGALLFFLPLYIMGLAQFWEILIVILGIGLILVELFVLPGFGIAGITGIVLLFFGLFASLVGNVGFNFPQLEEMRIQLWTLFITLVLTFAFIGSTLRYAMKTPFFGRLVLTRSTDKDSGYTSYSSRDDLMGQEGVTLTTLRISGTARIGDRRVDVVSDGEYIDKGTRVKVISTAAGQVVVTRVEEW